MKVWIQQCNKVNYILSWSGIVELIRRDYDDNDIDMTQKEIDLTLGAKDIKVIISH